MSFSGSMPACFIIMRAPTSGVAPKLLMPRVLPLRSLSDLYLRLGDQRHRPIVEKAGDDPHRQPGDRAADHRAEELAIIDIAGGQRRNGDIGIHADDLRVEIFVLEKAVFVGHCEVRFGMLGLETAIRIRSSASTGEPMMSAKRIAGEESARISELVKATLGER